MKKRILSELLYWGMTFFFVRILMETNVTWLWLMPLAFAIYGYGDAFSDFKKTV